MNNQPFYIIPNKRYVSAILLDVLSVGLFKFKKKNRISLTRLVIIMLLDWKLVVFSSEVQPEYRAQRR